MPYKDKERGRRAARESYHRRKAAGTIKKHPLICGWCQKEFLGAHRTSKFCSPACFHKHEAKVRKGATPPCNRATGHPPNYKGGRSMHRGYVSLHRPGHPMGDKRGRVMEHRLVMSQMLGRPLTPGEHVHHRNRIKTDNRPENLELADNHSHMAAHWEQKTITCPKCGHVLGVGHLD